MSNDKLKKLWELTERLYMPHNDKLLFHGWHHVSFVAEKSREFSLDLGADIDIVESAALVHDLNYIVRPYSQASEGAELRASLLAQSGYTENEISEIESLVMQATTEGRSKNISINSQALSDADTLFKALPITPVVLSGKFLTENMVDLQKLAGKIVAEQKPLLEG